MRGVVCIKTFSISIGILLILNATALTAHKEFKGALGDSVFRAQRVESLAQKAAAQKAHAHKIARQNGWKTKGKYGNISYELMSVTPAGKPIYNITCNVNSAISQGVDLIRDTSPYNLNGAGLTVGVWDAGDVRDTHQEFDSRVTLYDSAGYHFHSTHVAGTIAASGSVSSALGMAPSASIDSYDWTSDESETASRAASYPGEPGKIYISNHSYGAICGWQDGDYGEGTGPYWFGVWGQTEDESFGQYAGGAPTFDSTCYDAQYYLPFWAAGNDRNDSHPTNGTTFYYDYPFWKSKAYDDLTDPDDDYYDGGYDTILPTSTAKNVMTVGAVNDAVSGGLRSLPSATIATFSGYGPTDDGRIKPDIVANGVSLYSCDSDNDSDYISLSGTSMATPGASGAAILLAEYYGELFSGDAMLASTLKGLILHTADDLGNSGPDYIYGWGLMNAEAAAIQIEKQSQNPYLTVFDEELLDAGNPIAEYPFAWDGSSPIRVTICWTDPAGSTGTGLDNTTKRLVNDLDLRITGPDLTTYYPYILDPANPSNNATTGDNITDNVEQVYIAAPTEPGTYTVEVSYKETLTNNEQNFSIIISGQQATALPVDYFEFSTIQSPQDVNVPFEVSMAAKSIDGNTVTDFNDAIGLSGWVGVDGGEQIIGDGAVAGESPISVFLKQRRTQVIYLSSEIGQAGTIDTLGLDIVEVPGITRNNWTIRMQHTTISEFVSTDWTSTGWTTVYDNNEPPGSIGWQYYNLDTPFEYDGVSNLLVDFSFDNTDKSVIRGRTNTTSIATNRRLNYATNSITIYGPPTSWSGSSPPAVLQPWEPNIKLIFQDTKVSVAIEPNETTNFVDGLWSGNITVGEEAFDIYLRVDDGNGVISDSNLFDTVIAFPFEPNNPSPVDGANDIPLTTVLSWTGGSSSPCEVTYDIYIDTINPPAVLACADVNTTVCDPVLSCSTTYYWRVVAKNCHGNTDGAVWSFTTESLTGDFDFSCSVDFADYALLAGYWLTSEPSVDIAPAGGDGIIDTLDIATLIENWLSELFE